MSAEKEKKYKRREKRQAFSVQASENHAIAAELKEWGDRKTLQCSRSSSSAEVREKEEQTLEATDAESQQKDGTYLTEKRERKIKQKKQQKLGASESNIAFEDPHKGAGEQLWEGSDVLTLTDKTEKKKRKQRFKTCEKEGEPEEKGKKQKLEAIGEISKVSKGDFYVSAVAISSGLIAPLELLKVIRDREISPERKIQLTLNFVQTTQQQSTPGKAGIFSENGLISPSHFVTSLSEWVQTQISSASKAFSLHPVTNVKLKGTETSLIGERPAHLDERYWTVFRWCLLSGMEWKAGFISLNIMQALSCILDEASIVLSRDGTIDSRVKQTDLDYGTWGFTSTFFVVLLDVVKLLFNVYERSFRPKLDMWISCTRSSLKLASLVYPCTGKRDVSTDGLRDLLRLLLLLCRGFVRFLKSSPNPRKVFQAVVEKLLESLLTLFTGLSMKESGSHGAEMKDLLIAIENILKHSLFHQSHVDGYISVCNVSQQTSELCNDAITTELKVCKDAVTLESNKLHKTGKAMHVLPSLLSYHKLLFQKLDYFVKEGKVSILGSVAWILRTYIQESKGQAVSRSSTFLGVKSKHSKRPVDGENLGLDSGGDKIQVKDSQRSSSFAIFAELLFPLLKQLDVLASLHPLDSNFETSTLFIVNYVLSAVNSLLVVAKAEQIYVPTEDTPSLSHLNFMKLLYRKFMQLSTYFSKISSEVVSRHVKSQWSEEAQSLLLAAVKEVSLGIGHIMEVEYRVLENDLQNIWELILFGATLHSTFRGIQRKPDDNAETAATLASSAMKIFGELRQVELPIFSLCHFLRQLMIVEQAPSKGFKVKLRCKAVMSIYLSPKVLSTLATVVKEVPEGQLASFLKLLKSDMEETLETVQKLRVLCRDNSHQMHQAGMKVLMEIHLCILEHGNGTALNSIQVGTSLRSLMDVIVCPSLVYLVDSAVSGGNILADFLLLANWENKTENMNRCSLEDEEDQSYKASTAGSEHDTHIVSLIWEYIMRLYTTVKMLHRQCISLMPQKQARRACMAINDPIMLGLMGEAPHGDHSIHKEGFFSCIKKGNVSICKFLCNIKDWLQGTQQKNVDSFMYTLDCIAVHSLSDVKRQLKAVSFSLNQADQPGFRINQYKEGAEEQLDFGAAGIEMLNKADQKEMQKIHKRLRREASSLTSFLTKWIRSLDFNSKSLKERDRSVKLSAWEGGALAGGNMGWNKVICSLNRQTLLVARWDLLCQNINVWSELASEEDAIAFCRFMFGKTLLFEDEQNSYQSSSCTVCSVTSNLLECDTFYEQQVIRGVFLQALCQEVVQSLSLSKMNITVNSSLQYVEDQVFNAQEIPDKGCVNATKVQHGKIEQLEECTSSFFNRDSREFTKCVLIIKLVSKAPEGYIKAGSAATFISFITKLESCMVVWLLTSRKRFSNVDESCSGIDFSKLLAALELLLACRRSIESLLLQEGPLDCTLGDSHIITALLQDFGSMYWPFLSMHAVAICFDKIYNSLSDDAVRSSGKDMIVSYLNCTVGLFTFFSQRYFKELLNPLLLRNGNEHISSSNEADLNDSLGALMTTLAGQLKKCSKFVKVATSDYLAGLSNKESVEDPFKKENSTLQEHSFGVISSFGAVGSILWSITATLELLDEKCHLDKGGTTKWSGKLPGELLSWIQTVECFAIDSLQNILSTDRLASCVEMIGVNCSQDDDKLLVSQNGDEDNKRVITCLQNTQKLLAGASFDVIMEAFQDVADLGDQESGSDDYDVDVNEETDADERESNSVKNRCIKRLHEEESKVRKLCSPNVEERNHPSARLFGDLPLMLNGQVSLVKDMLLGRLEKLSWLAGELFMAMAAIVKLKSLFHSPNVINASSGELLNQEWSRSISLHVGAAITILQEAAKMPELKHVSSLILLPGVIKYLESFGSFLPYTRPTLAPAAFEKLVNTQMVLLGALLSKSQVTECLGSFEELTFCLQSCFDTLLKKPLGLHFHLALQTIERSLLGFQDNERRICFGGMKLTSSLLGGIECLAIVLDGVSGLKRLQILSKYCSRYLAAIFNLIVTCQSSWRKLHESKSALYLTTSFNAHDAAILIMKCVDILVTISSREVIFPMKANHVAQAISCPADLFKPLYQSNLQKEKLLQNMFTSSERFDFSEYNALILDDQMLSSEIYVACCKLLRNLLRHRKRESGHCVALMGESLRALLFFLEFLENTTSSRQLIKEKGKQTTVECASWLRRVYEEVAEHKETLGSYVVHMLSDYICIISGSGMSIMGLSREVETTLRPGAYALLDICSIEDLQQLHAVLGEGPRRMTLTDLRRDYEKHFKYTGKV